MLSAKAFNCRSQCPSGRYFLEICISERLPGELTQIHLFSSRGCQQLQCKTLKYWWKFRNTFQDVEFGDMKSKYCPPVLSTFSMPSWKFKALPKWQFWLSSRKTRHYFNPVEKKKEYNFTVCLIKGNGLNSSFASILQYWFYFNIQYSILPKDLLIP